MKNANTSRLGFTLIELLVVVLIIGILASVALPQYQLAVEKSRAAEAWVMLKAINEAEKRKNMEMDTNNVIYSLDDLDINFENVSTRGGGPSIPGGPAAIGLESGFKTKNFGYGIGTDWASGASAQAEPAMAVRLPHTNQNWYGDSSFDYALSFKNGKKLCANGYGSTQNWCQKIVGKSSASGCITGSGCFSE